MKHTKVKKEKLTTCMCALSIAQPDISQIKCNVGDTLTLTAAAELNKEIDAFH